MFQPVYFINPRERLMKTRKLCFYGEWRTEYVKDRFATERTETAERKTQNLCRLVAQGATRGTNGVISVALHTNIATPFLCDL